MAHEVQVYRDALTPRVIKQDDGRYTLRDIPIFQCHDREDIHCDDQWMYACIRDQQEKKQNGFLPRLIIGHNSEDPNAQEKPVAAFLDNYRYDPKTKWLYADYVDVPENLLHDLKANKYPGRSVEASRGKPAIDVVALLGGNPPYFKLPDLKFQEKSDKVHIVTELTMKISPATFMKYMALMEKAEAKKLKYEEVAKDEGMSPEERADYEKFCKYMKMYDEEKAKAPQEDDEEPKASPPEDKPYDDDEDTKKPEDDKKDEKDYAKGQLDDVDPEDSEWKAAHAAMRENGSQRVGASKHADRSERLNYQHLMRRVDELTLRNQALEEKNERAEWTQKYQAVQAPRGRLNIGEEVDFLMDLPTAKRQAYFDRSVKNLKYASPSTSPAATDAVVTDGYSGPGSESESRAIKKYYDENRAKYKGDFASAQRDWIAQHRK